MQNLRFDLPSLRFSELELGYNAATDTLVCDGIPLSRLLAENHLPLDPDRMKPSALTEMLIAWYLDYNLHGGTCTLGEKKAISMMLYPNDPRRLEVRWPSPGSVPAPGGEAGEPLERAIAQGARNGPQRVSVHDAELTKRAA